MHNSNDILRMLISQVFQQPYLGVVFEYQKTKYCSSSTWSLLLLVVWLKATVHTSSLHWRNGCMFFECPLAILQGLFLKQILSMTFMSVVFGIKGLFWISVISVTLLSRVHGLPSTVTVNRADLLNVNNITEGILVYISWHLNSIGTQVLIWQSFPVPENLLKFLFQNRVPAQHNH